MNRAERRAQILTHARDVFAERGYPATRVEDIVTSAHVGRGTFYLYFADKRAIFIALLEEFLVQIRGQLCGSDGATPTLHRGEAIRGRLGSILSMFYANPAMTKILLTDAIGQDAELDQKLSAFQADRVGELARWLDDGQQLGLVAATDARRMASALIGGLKELLIEELVRGRAQADRIETLSDEMFSLLSRAVLRSGDPVPRPSNGFPVQGREITPLRQATI